MSAAESSIVGPHLAAARAGSRDALGAALDHCRRFLLDAARDAVGPGLAAKGGASDLVQETYLEAQRQFPHFVGGSGGQFRAWLRRLLVHKAAHLGRRYRNTRKRDVGREQAPTAAVPAPTPTPSVQASADEELRRLDAAIARLPADYREVIALRYQEGLAFEEVGRRLGRSAEAARKLWARAFDRLKQDLADDPPAP